MAASTSVTWCRTARGHEVEGPGVDRAGHDIGLEVVEVRRGGVLVDEGQVDVDGDGLPGRAHQLGQPRRDGAVAEPDLQRARPRADAERLDVTAVHRVEQA